MFVTKKNGDAMHSNLRNHTYTDINPFQTNAQDT